MKAVILAAGQGSRLSKYTKDMPKGMLPFRGKPLLNWQIEQFRKVGIDNISIVTGYMPEKIQITGVTYYHNDQYMTTNMIESLMCLGDDLLQDDLLISYSDILFSETVLKLVLSMKDDIVVAADQNWRAYWLKRYGTTETDLESLSVNQYDEIIELGTSIQSSENIKYRYIGLNKLSLSALEIGRDHYLQKRTNLQSWQPSCKGFYQGYFTDFVNELIKLGVKAKIATTMNGWLEFDTATDYEIVAEMDAQKKLDEFIVL